MRDLLAPFGYAYGELANLRRRFYTNGFLRSEELPRPVVSVGNLTVGGTGKTPVVDAILEQIENDEKRACVLTRGYGRKSSGANPILLDCESSVYDGGDEPVWLARRHPKSLIAVGSDRVSASRLVSDVDLFILDDGLQHLQIKRDLDIVLLDCTRPLWHYKPLPWGYGRELFSSLKKSDIIILTRVNQAEGTIVEELVKILNDLGINQVIKSQVTIKGSLEIWGERRVDLADKKVYLLSGIGNPGSFEHIVSQSGVEIVGHEKKGDHFDYRQRDLDSIIEKAIQMRAEILLLTEKDAIKWEEFDPVSVSHLQIAKLETSLEFNPPLPRIYDLATNHIR